jgi:hypothetical protein
MPGMRFSLWVLGLLLGGPAAGAWAEPSAPAVQPKAADANSGDAPKITPAKPTPAEAATPDTAAKPAKHKPKDVAAATTDAKHKPVDADKPASQPMAAAPSPPPAAKPVPAAPIAPQPAAAAPKPAGPTCSLEEPEQPRGGRLDVLGSGFGQAPVVRIAAKPARMLERRNDRISVQVPADSDGGAVTLQSDGHSASCGNLVIIGKNR